jgi:hypothetical protein
LETSAERLARAGWLGVVIATPVLPVDATILLLGPQ